jgi:hypothetical protein
MKPALLAVALALGIGAEVVGAEEVNTCVSCHVDEEDEELSAPVEEWKQSAHAAAAVSCDGCHGGDPFEEDEELSMDEDENGYIGAPGWDEVPALCGACHEEILEGYNESVMASHIERGSRVAVCTTCHMTEGHAITGATPREILTEERCGECHDPERAFELLDLLEHTTGQLASVDAEVEVIRGALDTTRLDRELRGLRRRALVIAHTYDRERIAQISQVCDERLRAVSDETRKLIPEARFRRRLGAGVVLFFVLVSVGSIKLEIDLRRTESK